MRASAGRCVRRPAIIWNERTCSPSALLESSGRALRSGIVYVVGSVPKAELIAARRIKHGTQNPQCRGARPSQRALVIEEQDIVSPTCRCAKPTLVHLLSISPLVLNRYGFSSVAAIPSRSSISCHRAI